MKKQEYEFAIKIIEKRNGGKIHVPIARLKTKIKFLNFNVWMRIMKIYNTYDLSIDYIDRDFGLSNVDCMKHIEAFKKQQEKLFAEETQTIEMVFVEENLEESKLEIAI